MLHFCAAVHLLVSTGSTQARLLFEPLQNPQMHGTASGCTNAQNKTFNHLLSPASTWKSIWKATAAHNSGLLLIDYVLLWGIVACYVGLLGLPEELLGGNCLIPLGLRT